MAEFGYFEQALQRVDHQTNTVIERPITNNYFQAGGVAPRAAGLKLPPHLERFIYRIDRIEQWKALRPRVHPVLPNRPVCAIAAGTNDHAPDMLCNTLAEYINAEIRNPSVPPFVLLPDKLLSIPWKRSWDNCDNAWLGIANLLFGGEKLARPEDVRRHLAKRPDSIAFGLLIDAGDWDRHAENVRAWIDSLRQCELTEGNLVLALIVVRGRPTDAVQVCKVRGDLENHYQADNFVLVLPQIEAVPYHDLEEWHGDLLTYAESPSTVHNLRDMLSHLFGDTRSPLRMNDFINSLRSYISSAWVPPT